MISTDWDVDSYKTEHESDEHWELRRKFLITHKDRLPEDELVCMAQVFTNIEFLGCRYPDETMIRVAELAKGVVEEFREKKKNTLKRTFVAASEAASSKVKGLGRATGCKESDDSMGQLTGNQEIYCFPELVESEAATTSGSTSAQVERKIRKKKKKKNHNLERKKQKNEDGPVLTKKEQRLLKKIENARNPSSAEEEKLVLAKREERLLEKMAKEEGCLLTPKEQRCLKNLVRKENRRLKKNKLLIKAAEEGDSSFLSKKEKRLLERIKQKENCMLKENKKFPGVKPINFVAASSLLFSESTVTSKPKPPLNKVSRSPPVPLLELKPHPGPLGKLVVFISSKFGAFVSLRNSVERSGFHQLFKYEEKNLADGSGIEGQCFFGNELFCTGQGPSKKATKKAVGITALKKLRETCYTLVVRSNIPQGQVVEESDLALDSEQSTDRKIGDDNVGSKMMRLMGWEGGGLGKAAQGRVDPVKAVVTVRRGGLGGVGKNFRQSVQSYLQKWVIDGGKSNLLFSTDFDKDQRIVVHEVASKLGLKSKSHGKEPERTLVVSKKEKLWDIVEQVALYGNQNYDLLEPGTPMPSDLEKLLLDAT